MQEISNSLRQRLRARPEPETHPDPDQLTAYVEQLLPSAERATVVEHLAECSYCREVVALSLPEPQTQPLAHPPAHSRWWIPAYRWAAAAATIAVAATLIIEKPWQPKQVQFQEPATVSEKAQPAPPVETVTNGLVANAPITTGREESRLAAPARATRGRDGSEPARIASSAPLQLQASPPPQTLGVVGGAVSMPKIAPPPPQPAPQKALLAEHRADTDATDAASKDAKQDYVNRRVLRGETVEVTAESPAVVPEAPSPKAGVSGQRVTAQGSRGTPPIKQESLATNTMDFAVAQPQTTTPSTPPAATDNNLAKSGGAFRLKSKVTDAVKATVATVKKATAAKPPVSSFSMAGLAPASNMADADKESRQQPVERIQWTVTPDGRLLKSTEVGQWHEAYQGTDLQFRFVQQSGTGEVWAGGNHGTLIHSWNAGVNWSKLNVPDSSSTDITAIAIDGDNVQVKTSNGKTFVSDDHGKTWVPLNQNPQ